MTAKQKVLVIDDEPVVIWSCDRILTRAGIAVEGATSGQDGLLLAGTSRYDAMLLDLNMPDMHGMEVLRRIKQTNPEIIVIIITGFASVETAVEALKLGVFDYVSKPFTPNELASTVQRALAQQKPVKPVAAPSPAPDVTKRSSTIPSGQGRSIQMINQKREMVAIIGLGGVFRTDSAFFTAVRESFKRANVPITIEYGNHEVMGKEILSYLEDHDKIIVVTNAVMKTKPGTIKKFHAADYRLNRWSPVFEVPQIGFPYISAWAKSIDITSDLVVIAVEMDGNEDTCSMDPSVQRNLLTEIWLEIYWGSRPRGVDNGSQRCTKWQSRQPY
ncbi:MAG: response regulator [bacterium]|nr:MAG: response regulator [bacterium]